MPKINKNLSFRKDQILGFADTKKLDLKKHRIKSDGTIVSRTLGYRFVTWLRRLFGAENKTMTHVAQKIFESAQTKMKDMNATEQAKLKLALKNVSAIMKRDCAKKSIIQRISALEFPGAVEKPQGKGGVRFRKGPDSVFDSTSGSQLAKKWEKIKDDIDVPRPGISKKHSSSTKKRKHKRGHSI